MLSISSWYNLTRTIKEDSMKKSFILFILSLLLISCANVNKAATQALINKDEINQTVINTLRDIVTQENDIKVSFDSSLNDQNNQALTSYVTSFNEKIEHFMNALNSFKKTVDIEINEEMEDSVKTLVNNVNTLYEQLEANYNSVLENLNQKKTHLEALSTSLTQEQPDIQEVESNIEALNTLQKEATPLLEAINTQNTQLNAQFTTFNQVINKEEVMVTPIEATSREETEKTEETPEAQQETNYKYRIDPATFHVRAIESSDEKPVLLTFDDTIQPESNSHSMKIAETLNAQGLKAIFFVNGMFLKTDFGKEQLKKIYDMGFSIGNHSTNHPNLSEISAQEVRQEIVETNELVKEITGEYPRFFRPPFGVMGPHAKAIVEEFGMINMNWTFGYDWESEYQDAAALTEITLNSPFLSSGANILMHDRRWTGEAIGDIAKGLIDQGYTIVDPAQIEGGTQ